MFLLKLNIFTIIGWTRNFTFHNVSIKTSKHSFALQTLHPLHSTMFLLKPRLEDRPRVQEPTFTFHNVSIKTMADLSLLKMSSIFTFHNVSIKTNSCFILCREIACFTFHNVSIKTNSQAITKLIDVNFTFHNVSIKTFWSLYAEVDLVFLYIPQCFY